MASSAQTPEQSNSVPLEGVTVEPRRDPDSQPPNAIKVYFAEQGERDRHHATLERLRSWHDWDQARRTSLTRFCLSKLKLSKRSARPKTDDLISLASYYFPLRKDLKIIVCDFGAGRFKRSERSLTVVRDVLNSKPEWATVRWIHIPLGPSWLASLLQDYFLHSAPEDSIPEQPYLQCEVLSFRTFQHLRNQIDVIQLLKPALVTHKLYECNFDRQFHEFVDDILLFLPPSDQRTWRNDFLEDAELDLPALLTEGGYGDPQFSTVSQLPSSNDQVLSQHPSFTEGVILVRDIFQSFHRKDGFLLTMSPMIGTSYSDSIYQVLRKERILLSPLRLDLLELTSRAYRDLPVIKHGSHEALELLRQRWSAGDGSHSQVGTDSWEDKNVEWLQTSILTELEGTPCKQISQGPSPTDIQTAYIRIVQDLRKRQTLPLKRYESVELVRQYANCMNEISCVHDISEQKICRLEEIRKRRVEFEKGPMAGVTMPNNQPKLSERIEERIEMIKANHKHLPRLLKDLKGSLDVLFQTRTMEQNELTLIAESNNRAILVFTIVTIIFLPLSFFTSYFGMNIRGIADTDKTERYFWAVCGSVTALVVGLTIIFGFKERLHRWLLSRISED